MVPPEETIQEYPVIPDSVVYTLPAVFRQTVADPVIAGTGKGLTITFFTVAVEAIQLLAAV